MKLRRIIATISAVATLMTSAITANAYTNVQGTYYEMPLAVNEYFAPGSYQISNEANEKWVLKQSSNGDNQNKCKIATNNAATGGRSLYLTARNGGSDTEASVQMAIYFGDKTGDGTYTIQFDMAGQSRDWRDYVALNMDGWDGKARLLNEGTVWSKGEGFTGSLNEAQVTFHTYTATFKTNINPELYFGVFGGGNMFVDNIIIKDSTGTVVFSEDFEGGIPEIPEEPEIPEVPEFDPSVPKHTYLHGNYYEIPFDLASTADFTPGEFQIGDTSAKWVYENFEAPNGSAAGKKGRAKITTANVVTGDRALYIYAQNDDASPVYNPGAKITLHLGKITGNGTYQVQFDMAPWSADYRDFVAMNMAGWDGAAKIKDGEGGTIWTRGQEVVPSHNGDNLKYYTYTGTVSTENSPELSFAVWGYSRMVIDNIIIKDSTGTIVFSEGFEGGIPEGWVPPVEPDEPEVPEFDPSVPKHTYLHGNYYDIPFDLASTADFTPGEFAIEGTNAKWVYENNAAPNGSAAGKKGRAKITTANVVTGDRALYIYAQNADASPVYNPGAKITLHLGKITGNGTYQVQFDMAPWSADYRDFVAMNMAGWDGAAKIKEGEGGTIWTRGEEVVPSHNGDNLKYYTYTGTVSTENSPELSFAVWGYSRMVIDNIIIKDSTGTIVFSEGFEGGIPEGWVPPVEPDEPEVPEFDPSVPKHTYLHGNYYDIPFDLASSADFTPGEFVIEGTNAKWVYENNAAPNGSAAGKKGRAKITTANVVTGDRALYIYAQNDDASPVYNPGAKITLHLGKITGNGTYQVQFDMAPWSADYRDFVAMNMVGWDGAAKIKEGEGGTIWTRGEEVVPSHNGDNLKYYTYTGTVSTENSPELSFAVWGYSRMVIDNIIIKDSTGTIVFSEGFEGGIPEGWVPPVEPDEPEVGPSYTIHDAEFEVVELVDGEYVYVETPEKLTANVLLKSSVKIENASESNPVSAVVYTALYKNEKELVYVDVQTVTAVTGGEMSSGSVINIPALDDGVYTLKAFVWDDGMCPIKDVKSLGE